MAVTHEWYGKGAQHVMRGDVDLQEDDIKVLLTTSGYTPNKDTHEFRSDVTNEVTGTGYVAGGISVADLLASYDAASNEARVDATNPTFEDVSVTARRAVFYKVVGSAATDILLTWVDFGEDRTTSASDLALIVDSTGLFVGRALVG
jgi:hypothetical protein